MPCIWDPVHVTEPSLCPTIKRVWLGSTSSTKSGVQITFASSYLYFPRRLLLRYCLTIWLTTLNVDPSFRPHHLLSTRVTSHRHGRYSRLASSPLATNDLAHTAIHEPCPRCSHETVHLDASHRSSSIHHNDVPQTITKSARYPRVAVLLGISHRYYIPLLICRAFSIIFVFIWAVQASLQIWHLWHLWGERGGDKAYTSNEAHDSILLHHLRLVQFALSFVWVCHPCFPSLVAVLQCPVSAIIPQD